MISDTRRTTIRTSSQRARLAFVCLGFAALLACGCQSIRDQMEEFTLALRNRAYARGAWLAHHKLYRDVDYVHDFSMGFIAGYEAVAGGGSGCQPTLPPRKYWAPRYQSPEGHERTLTWFEGYSHGALAGKQDGIGEWATIPISHEARTNLTTYYSTPEPEPDPQFEQPYLPPPPLPPPVPLAPPATPILPPARPMVPVPPLQTPDVPTASMFPSIPPLVVTDESTDVNLQSDSISSVEETTHE